MKRPKLLEKVAKGLVAGCAHRQIARTHECAPSTVTRIAARLGRHCLLLQAEALDELAGRVEEPFVFDHFETFVFSQDDRLGIGTAVGQRSRFVYAFDPAPHRRAGQRGARRPSPRRPLPKTVTRSFVHSTERVLGILHRLAPRKTRLISDDHPAYRAAVPAEGRVDHAIYGNPPRGPGSDGRLAAERDRALYEVDLLHKLIRHSQAAHRRETIAQGRRSNALLERMAVMAVWRNFVKKVSERSSAKVTPAMRLGIASRMWSWCDVLARRRFPDRIRLPDGWMKIYRRGWITPAVGRNCVHDLKYAF
jgi:hypothetical protein